MTTRSARDVDPSRRAVFDAAADSAVTVVIGESDVGKTTLVTAIANDLLARRFSVGVVDADIGQSEVGPPTTVGLGRVTRPLARLGDAELVAMRFVGATSAARDQLATVVATRRLVDRARELGLARIVVDTSGLVRGDLGRRLKQAKIDAIAPRLVVAIQRDAECEAIVHPYERSDPTRVLRVTAAAVRPRTQEQRRRHREQRLAAHLAGATAVMLDLSRVALKSPGLFVGPPLSPDECRAAEAIVGTPIAWAERRGSEVAVVTATALDDAAVRRLARHLRSVGLVHHTLGELEDVLAGLDDVALETLGLGVVRGIDFGARTISLTTAVPPERVASITVGRERYRAAGP